MGRKTGVLIIDSSEVSRRILRRIIESDPDIEFLAEASYADESLYLVQEKKPDVILIDISVPNNDGVKATSKIMAFCPTPIILLTVSTDTACMKNAFEALACGASEVCEKPVAANKNTDDFLKLVKLVSKVKVITHLAGKHNNNDSKKNTDPIRNQNVILIAASTGGPNALNQVLSKIDPRIKAGIIVAQHIAKGFMPGLVSWLSQECKMEIREATSGDKLQQGLILFCPAGKHAKFTSSGAIKLIENPYEQIAPSADILFDSGAEVFGAKSVGVVLTGMGSDGARGLLKIKEYGGITIAQDEKTSVVFGMPKKAINLNAAQKVLAVDKIAGYLNKIFGK